MSNNVRNLAVWALIITMFLVMITVSTNTMQASNAPVEYKYSELIANVEAGSIKSAKIEQGSGAITGETADGKKYTVIGNIYDTERTEELFTENNIPFEFKELKQTGPFMALLFNILPLWPCCIVLPLHAGRRPRRCDEFWQIPR